MLWNITVFVKESAVNMRRGRELFALTVAVAKSEKFWWATEQSNLADRLDWKTAPLAKVQLCEQEN